MDTTRERVYLFLAVVGFVVPNAMVAIFFARHGFELGQYFGDWYGTLPAAQINIDLAIVLVTFFCWAIWETRDRHIPHWWWLFPATFLVGLCFGAPLFLWLREREINRSVVTSTP